jgi:hypothetical protein
MKKIKKRRKMQLRIKNEQKVTVLKIFSFYTKLWANWKSK